METETAETTSETKNVNAEIIRDLRALLDFMESRPNLPLMKAATLYMFVDTREELIAGGRALGSFTKHFTDFYVECRRKFGNACLQVTTRRSNVCKKIERWECPDEPFLNQQLKEAGATNVEDGEVA